MRVLTLFVGAHTPGRQARRAAAAIDTGNRAIAVAMFQGETREFVLEGHRELRPDHAGRQGRFEHRNEPRTEMAEMFAVLTRDELKVVLDHIEAEGRGLTVGQRMLRDAHGWGHESDPRLCASFQ
jgi:hypothetical protein